MTFAPKRPYVKSRTHFFKSADELKSFKLRAREPMIVIPPVSPVVVRGTYRKSEDETAASEIGKRVISKWCPVPSAHPTCTVVQ